MKIDPARERKSAVLQGIGGLLILIGGVGALTSGSIWQAALAGAAGAYFIGSAIFKWVTTREDFPDQ